MSVWNKYKSNILKNTDMNLLEKALKNMGLGLDRNAKHVQNSWGEDDVDAAVTDKDGDKLSIGFKNTTNREGDKMLEITGDFFGTGINERTFTDELSQNYQKERITEQMQLNGYELNLSELNKDKSMYLEFSILN